jgi:hypothetical protein
VKEKNDNTKPFSLTITISKVNFDEHFSHWEWVHNVNQLLQAEYTAPPVPGILDEVVSYLYQEYSLEISQDANNLKYSFLESLQAIQAKEDITNEILALLANLLPGQNERELWMNGKNKAFLISPLEMIEKGRAQEVIAYLQTNTQGPC